MKTEILSVSGMSCLHCKHAITTSVSALTGVQTVDVDLSAKTVRIIFDTDKLTLDTIKLAIEEAGYDVI